MSGGLFVSALLRETGLKLTREQIDELQVTHAEAYEQQVHSVKPLPGAAELLSELTARGVPWAIATSGYARAARLALGMLGLPEDTPMVTRDLVRRAKPDPDLFLAGAAVVQVDPRHAMVVGDSVWDLLAARRAGAVSLRRATMVTKSPRDYATSGGYGRDELERAGAFRVYADPADMLDRLDELGVRFAD
ncbi:HAD family hydrolase [Nonomuraea sp. H19]|uniref:HAD family hydrolase n=1 Tax=Nonomuraea sp. H19 TaxID=3452206 RepID=UPI003F8A6B5F